MKSKRKWSTDDKEWFVAVAIFFILTFIPLAVPYFLVSIMTSLTSPPMTGRIESLDFYVNFLVGPPKTTAISVTNLGSCTLSVSSVTIDDVPYTPSAWGGSFTGSTHDLAKGESGTITISNWNWTSGSKYTFALLTTSGFICAWTTTANP
jgi:hypothetical protein